MRSGYCVPERLCPTCADDQYRWQVPTAEQRGAAWAASVAKRLPAQVHTLPWALIDERVWEMARKKVSDLSLDSRVVSQLALVCHFANVDQCRIERGLLSVPDEQNEGNLR